MEPHGKQCILFSVLTDGLSSTNVEFRLVSGGTIFASALSNHSAAAICLELLGVP